MLGSKKYVGSVPGGQGHLCLMVKHFLSAYCTTRMLPDGCMESCCAALSASRHKPAHASTPYEANDMSVTYRSSQPNAKTLLVSVGLFWKHFNYNERRSQEYSIQVEREQDRTEW